MCKRHGGVGSRAQAGCRALKGEHKPTGETRDTSWRGRQCWHKQSQHPHRRRAATRDVTSTATKLEHQKKMTAVGVAFYKPSVFLFCFYSTKTTTNCKQMKSRQAWKRMILDMHVDRCYCHWQKTHHTLGPFPLCDVRVLPSLSSVSHSANMSKMSSSYEKIYRDNSTNTEVVSRHYIFIAIWGYTMKQS